MWIVALRMLLGGKAKYVSLVIGLTTTSFLVTFAACFFCGMMTRSFALITETPGADVWVMDPAVTSDEETTAIPQSVLDRVRGVPGVRYAVPLVLASTDLRFGDGRFQPVQVIGVDDATLLGMPPLEDGAPVHLLRSPDAAAVADGGTENKLDTPDVRHQWRRAGPGAEPSLRPLAAGDEVLVNDSRVKVVGRVGALPRFPPRPLLYMTYSNALRVLPVERLRTTFVLVSAAKGLDPAELARRIEKQTGFKARTREEFKADTVKWYVLNCEDVGDAETLLSIAMLVGLGVTGVMLFLFTQDNLRYYAMLKAMGASRKQLIMMVMTQAGGCAVIGAGIGIGACAAARLIAEQTGLPFRMMWFTPLVGGVGVLLVTLVAAAVSLWPVLKLQPASVFAVHNA